MMYNICHLPVYYIQDLKNIKNVKGCRDGMQTRYDSEGKFTKPHPCIVFTLVCNCNVKRCRDRAL